MLQCFVPNKIAFLTVSVAGAGSRSRFSPFLAVPTWFLALLASPTLFSAFSPTWFTLDSCDSEIHLDSSWFVRFRNSSPAPRFSPFLAAATWFFSDVILTFLSDVFLTFLRRYSLRRISPASYSFIWFSLLIRCNLWYESLKIIVDYIKLLLNHWIENWCFKIEVKDHWIENWCYKTEVNWIIANYCCSKNFTWLNHCNDWIIAICDILVQLITSVDYIS